MDFNSIWEQLMQMAEAEGFFYKSELMAVIFGIVYVVLAARENIWCWFWGILSCMCWTYAAFFVFNLQIDGWLQVFYVVMGFVGLYQWRYGSKEKENLDISVTSVNMHLSILLGGTLISLLLGYVFDHYTTAAATYLDAFTTVFSIIATFMVVQKKLENWLYWVVIDLVYVYLYYSRGGYLFAVLFILYTIIALNGYFSWRQKYQQKAIS